MHPARDRGLKDLQWKLVIMTQTLINIGLILFIRASTGEIHSLKYFYTTTSGIPDVAEFIAVGMVDDIPITHYDSKRQVVVSSLTWMLKNLDQNYWEEETEMARTAQQALKADINTLKSRFNHTGGSHILQRMYGCDWNSESGQTNGYERYGYDGEDFMSLDMHTMRWIAPRQEAVPSKNKWDTYESQYSSRKTYFNNDCPNWLKKYAGYKASSLRNKGPEVTVIRRAFSVLCHATGFYPEGVVITWKRNGEEIHDDVDMGETLPNMDGTFQKGTELRVSPEERKNYEYTCEVEHKTGSTVVTLSEETGFIHVIIGCVVALMGVCVTAIIIIFIFKKKGYKKAEESDTDSDDSWKPYKN